MLQDTSHSFDNTCIKLVTYFKFLYRVQEQEAPHFFELIILSMHLLRRMNAMHDFSCMGPVDMPGTCGTWKIQNEKFLNAARLELTTLCFVGGAFTRLNSPGSTCTKALLLKMHIYDAIQLSNHNDSAWDLSYLILTIFLHELIYFNWKTIAYTIKLCLLILVCTQFVSVFKKQKWKCNI